MPFRSMAARLRSQARTAAAVPTAPTASASAALNALLSLPLPGPFDCCAIVYYLVVFSRVLGFPLVSVSVNNFGKVYPVYLKCGLIS